MLMLVILAATITSVAAWLLSYKRDSPVDLDKVPEVGDTVRLIRPTVAKSVTGIYEVVKILPRERIRIKDFIVQSELFDVSKSNVVVITSKRVLEAGK